MYGISGLIVLLLFVVGFIAHLRDEARREQRDRETAAREWRQDRGA